MLLSAVIFVQTFMILRFSFNITVLHVNITKKLILSIHKLLLFMDTVWAYICYSWFLEHCFYIHMLNFVVIELDI